MILDMERRIESACLELLQANTDLIGLSANVRSYADASQDAAYPAALVMVHGLEEAGENFGWYYALVTLIAITYREDDEDQVINKKVLGALRGWAQQTDLVNQLNNTTSAQAADTLLDVRYFVHDGIQYQTEQDRAFERGVDNRILVRPSRTIN